MVLVEDVVWSGMVADDEWDVLLGVGGVVDVVTGFRDFGSRWYLLEGVVGLLDCRIGFLEELGCSSEETVC